MNKEYIYYWYHHMMPIQEITKIETIIKEKDYFRFIELFQIYNAKGLINGKYDTEFETYFPIVYFPDTITVYENDEIIECISVLNKKNFESITFSECECG